MGPSHHAGRRPARSGWAALVVETGEPVDEDLGARIATSTLGAVEGRSPAGGATLTVYCDTLDEARARERDVVELLTTAGYSPETFATRTEQVADERWVERYAASLTPFPIGTGFVVDPGDRPAVTEDGAGGRRVLRLVPGRAFGTGEHATTRLCVEALERLVVPGSRWLDVGCGTAILSLVARCLGAAAVLGVDIDPEAIEVAGTTLAANPGIDGIELLVGGVDRSDETWDGVVANVNAAYVGEHGRRLATRVGRGGLLVVSGLLEMEAVMARRTIASLGLEPFETRLDGGWAAIVARRPA